MFLGDNSQICHVCTVCWTHGWGEYVTEPELNQSTVLTITNIAQDPRDGT